MTITVCGVPIPAEDVDNIGVGATDLSDFYWLYYVSYYNNINI